MIYTNEQYKDSLAFVSGVFTLGGLSECGKTTAGNRLKELGVRKSKIIQIEYEMMRDRGLDPEKGVTSEDFENLYRETPEKSFEEFLFRLIEKMKEENFRFASLESLYRAPLGVFIKRELGGRAMNIYIEAPLEDRAYREYLKVNRKARENGDKEISLDDMIECVRKKDEFKMERNATAVKDIADCIIDNSRSVTFDQFISLVDGAAQRMGVASSRNPGMMVLGGDGLVMFHAPPIYVTLLTVSELFDRIRHDLRAE